jgi:hypothetical protein
VVVLEKPTDGVQEPLSEPALTQAVLRPNLRREKENEADTTRPA